MTYFWIGCAAWLALGVYNYAVAFAFMTNVEFTRPEDAASDRRTAAGFFLLSGLVGSAVLIKDKAYFKYPLRWW